MKRSGTLLIFGAVFVCVAAIFLFNRSRSAAPPGLFSPGVSTFELTLESNGRVDPSQMGASFQGQAMEPIRSTMAAELQVARNGLTTEFRLKDVKFSVNGQVMQTPDFRDSGLTIEDSQAGQRFGLSSTQSTLETSVWLAFYAAIQTHIPTESSSNWTIVEDTESISYEANYVWSKQTLSKQRASIRGHEFQGSKITVSLGPNETWLANFEGHKLKDLRISQSLTVKNAENVFYENYLKLNLVAKNNAGDNEPNKITISPNFQWQRQVLNQATKQKSFEDIYKAETEGKAITSDSIKSRLKAVHSKDDEVALYKDTRSYFYRNPGATKDFEDDLVEDSLGQLGLQIVGVAIGSVGHAEAQETLRNVIQRRIENKATINNYLSLLSQARSPEKVTMDFLVTLSTKQEPELREAAMLSYGTSLSNYKDKDSLDAAKRGARLLDNFAKASNKDKLLIVDTLGNSELTESVPLLAENIKTLSRGDTLRSTSIEALRMIDSSSARSILWELLESGDPEDSLQALRALKYQKWEKDVIAANGFASNLKKDAALRSAYAEWIQINNAHISDGRERLEDLYRVEDNLDVKRSIKSILETMP